MSFRLTTILWAFAVAAAAMAAFGRGVILAAPVVIGLWIYTFRAPSPQSRWQRFLGIMVGLCTLILIGLIMLASVVKEREAARSLRCMNQMRLLAISAHRHCESHGTYPPASFRDSSGKPTVSWRAALLPYVMLGTLRLDMDETSQWNDPASVNALITAKPQRELMCPSNFSSTATTDYFAVVDPRAAWLGSRGRIPSEFADGRSQTILLIEVHDKGVNWGEPRDITFDEAVELLTHPVPLEDGHSIDVGFFHKGVVGRNVVFADGRGAFIDVPLDRALARALLTIDGGEDVEDAVTVLTDNEWNPPLDYPAIYALAAFGVIAMLPVLELRCQSAQNCETT